MSVKRKDPVGSWVMGGQMPLADGLTTWRHTAGHPRLELQPAEYKSRRGHPWMSRPVSERSHGEASCDLGPRECRSIRPRGCQDASLHLGSARRYRACPAERSAAALLAGPKRRSMHVSPSAKLANTALSASVADLSIFCVGAYTIVAEPLAGLGSKGS